MGAMLSSTIQALDEGQVNLYQLRWEQDTFTYEDVLDLWRRSEDFREQFLVLLRECQFPAFRWEMPPISTATAGQNFEFILRNDPLLQRPADEATLADHFDREGSPDGVANFDNLSGDAHLIAPTPRGELSAYSHLAAFIHHGPDWQQHAVLQCVGTLMRQRLSEEPIWLSTAGEGVAWLHIRLDTYPKYYTYRPYARLP
ncbi:MAG: DUF6940 family protein [Gammaproteobacteria bacterium]